MSMMPRHRNLVSKQCGQAPSCVVVRRSRPLTAAAPPPGRLPTRATVGRDPTPESSIKEIDDKLSWRPLLLDPAGYFIIRIDREALEIVADHYSNAINEKGLAVDDETGEVIGCRPGGAVRLPRRTFRGRTAKEISVNILEDQLPQHEGQQQGPQSLPWISRLEHANYLGREFVRAEIAMLSGTEYIQD